MVPKKLNKGDTIGVVAPSNPIIGDNIEEINTAKKMVEKAGFKVKFAKNLFSNTYGYSATPKEKANDINYMFEDKNIKMIWCAKGGCNSNTIFEYLDYELIRKNPKIICGYSDITSITNIIHERTGLVTFSGTNFKTIATDETDYSFKEVLKRFVDKNLELGTDNEEYITLKEGKAEGELIGGNLNLFHNLVNGKYNVNLQNKIIFLEDFGLESAPEMISNYVAYMKQNDVFKKIAGLWIGSYKHESNIALEKIIIDIIGEECKFPIIKSNNFGHIEKKIVIPIGTKAIIDTNETDKIKLLEECVK